MTAKPAHEIGVHAYRQILIWPLLLKSLDAGADDPEYAASRDDQLRDWTDALASRGWAPAPTLPAAVTTALGPEITYEEIVYFHPHVRDFLYGDGDPNGKRPLLRLRRDDVTHVELIATPGSAPLRLRVERLELYLCKPLIGLLVLDVTYDGPAAGGPGAPAFTLADAMQVQSWLRQVYPPYFIGDAPGNCPRVVSFLGGGGATVLARSDFDAGRDHFARFVHRGAEPPVAAHWAWLLEPLSPYPGQLPGLSGRFYQQIEDDRIPGMTYLAVDDPRAVSEGDYDRLTFADTAGRAAFPYAPDFLDRRRDRYTYDRFWRRAADHDVPPAGGDSGTTYDTRYLCSGYQYVTVVGKDNGMGFLLRDHFGRHYFRMGLLLHFQRAALLKFRDELAEAVKLLGALPRRRELGDRAFRERVASLQHDLLKFRARAFFTEVSNQLQGRELFAWWAGLLGIADLFEQVDVSSRRVHAALTEYESTRLTRVATYAVPYSLALSFASVVAAFAAARGGTPWGGVGLTIGAFVVALGMAYLLLGATGVLGPFFEPTWPGSGGGDEPHSGGRH